MKEQHLLEQIVECVKACGEIILNADRTACMVDAKAGEANFVTTYDKRYKRHYRRNC